jgi:hypothetical protein
MMAGLSRVRLDRDASLLDLLETRHHPRAVGSTVRAFFVSEFHDSWKRGKPGDCFGS